MYRAQVIVAAKDPQSRRKLKKALMEAGYMVIGEASDGAGALRAIRALKPDIAIVDEDITAPTGLEIARICDEDRLAPVLLLTSHVDWDFVERARESGVLAHLVKPVTRDNIISSVESALFNYRRTLELEKTIKDLQDRLETRKVIEKAKGILMQNLGISEAEAYRLIQKQSMDRSTSMRAIAEAIVLAHELEGKGRRGS